MTTFPAYVNNALATLASPYTAGSGSLVLGTGQGAIFGSTFPIRVTVVTQATFGTSAESLTIYQVTGRSGDTLTGVTAVEGTTDADYLAGAYVEMRWTAGEANLVSSAVNALESAGPGLTSVGLSMPAGFSVSGSPLTSNGTIAVATSLTGLLKGASGAITAATAGTDYLTPNGSGAGLTGVVLTTGTYSQPSWLTSVAGSIVSGNITGDAASITGSITESQVTNLATDLASKAPATTGTSILAGNGSGGFSAVTIGSGLTFTGGTLAATAGGGGTVTTVSVVSANGFGGTVANASTAPAITLTTTVTGLLKGNGTAVSAAAAGTDYVSPAGTWPGNASLTDLGTIASGTWQATVIAPTYGGTGSNLSATGPGYVKQAAGGANLSVGAIASADLPTTGLAVNQCTSAITSDTDGTTITFNLGASNWHSVTLGGNRTLALSNVGTNQQFTLVLIQDATGSRAVTWWAGIKWPGGTVPTLSTSPGAIDVFTFKQISSGVYYGFTAGQGMA